MTENTSPAARPAIDTSRWISDQDRDAFRRGYVAAMLWTNAEDENGERVEDMTYAYHAPGSWWTDTPVDLTDADAFMVAEQDDLRATGEDDWSQHGHDFALTRNHHGAGFWDRGYDHELGARLTSASHAYGEAMVTIPGEDDDAL